MKKIEVIGVYVVPNHDRVHLLEIKTEETAIDFGLFTQEDKEQPAESWQTAYDELFLNSRGDKIIDLNTGFRATFFFHHLDFNKPFRTPFGEVKLPASEAMPERLKKVIQYHDVD